MLGVTAVGAGASSGVVTGRVTEKLDETVVVTNNKGVAVGRLVNTVDVGSIGSAGEDSFVGPGEVDGCRGPLSSCCVGAARVISLHAGHVEIKDLMGTTVGADVATVAGPVKGNNEGRVADELTLAGPVFGTVDVNVVVVGSNSELGVVRGERHALVPFLGLGEEVAFGFGVGSCANRDLTVVSGNNNP